MHQRTRTWSQTMCDPAVNVSISIGPANTVGLKPFDRITENSSHSTRNVHAIWLPSKFKSMVSITWLIRCHVFDFNSNSITFLGVTVGVYQTGRWITSWKSNTGSNHCTLRLVVSVDYLSFCEAFGVDINRVFFATWLLQSCDFYYFWEDITGSPRSVIQVQAPT